MTIESWIYFCQLISVFIPKKCRNTRTWRSWAPNTHGGWTICPIGSSGRWPDRQTAKAWRLWRCLARNRSTKMIITWIIILGTWKPAGWWGTCVATVCSGTSTKTLRMKWSGYELWEVHKLISNYFRITKSRIFSFRKGTPSTRRRQEGQEIDVAYVP